MHIIHTGTLKIDEDLHRNLLLNKAYLKLSCFRICSA